MVRRNGRKMLHQHVSRGWGKENKKSLLGRGVQGLECISGTTTNTTPSDSQTPASSSISWVRRFAEIPLGCLSSNETTWTLQGWLKDSSASGGFISAGIFSKIQKFSVCVPNKFAFITEASWGCEAHGNSLNSQKVFAVCDPFFRCWAAHHSVVW